MHVLLLISIFGFFLTFLQAINKKKKKRETPQDTRLVWFCQWGENSSQWKTHLNCSCLHLTQDASKHSHWQPQPPMVWETLFKVTSATSTVGVFGWENKRIPKQTCSVKTQDMIATRDVAKLLESEITQQETTKPWRGTHPPTTTNLHSCCDIQSKKTPRCVMATFMAPTERWIRVF